MLRGMEPWLIAVALLPIAGWLIRAGTGALRRKLEPRFREGRLKRILFTRLD